MKIDEQETRRLILHIVLDEDADDEQVDQATRQLRSELLELDVDTVDLVKPGERIEGTKSVEADFPSSIRRPQKWAKGSH